MFIPRFRRLFSKLLKPVYIVERLRSSLRTFYCRWGILLSDMKSPSCECKMTFWAYPVTVPCLPIRFFTTFVTLIPKLTITELRVFPRYWGSIWKGCGMAADPSGKLAGSVHFGSCMRLLQLFREKERDLSQSYDKSPIQSENESQRYPHAMLFFKLGAYLQSFNGVSFWLHGSCVCPWSGLYYQRGDVCHFRLLSHILEPPLLFNRCFRLYERYSCHYIEPDSISLFCIRLIKSGVLL